MRYRVLGPVEAADGAGNPAPLAGARQHGLLAILLANAGHAVSADRLAEHLWGDRQPADPRAALQSQVSRLRRQLGPGSGLQTTGACYRLSPAADDVDANVYERLLGEAEAATDPSHTLRLLDAALSLWRGPAYGEHGGHPAIRIAATRLEELRTTAREERAALLLALGRTHEAAAEALALVADQPLHERAVTTLVEAYYEAGRTSEALTAYDTYRRRLADELGLDPGEELARLHLRILRRDRNIGGGRGALPRPVTSLVGRQDEVDHLMKALRDLRQVTLTGPGGVGKTRLALEAAAAVANDFPDGLWFCDLAAVTEDQVVPAAVSSILGVQRRPGYTVTDRLVEVLSGRQALLLLDNCEHVRASAAGLTHQLLELTADVHVLATSREPLGLPGEHRVVVAPLSEGDAIRLFTDRAAAARPGLAFTDEDFVAARRICRQVDGLPLGVELAAARAAARTPIEIAADLADRVAQLSATRSGPAHHQSVAAFVDWSLDWLTADQRELAEHLAVFAGGCMAEGAAAVFGRDVGETADLLVELVDRCIVTPHPAGPHTRYTILEPVRARAEQRLRGRGLLATARRRHASYFAALTSRAGTGLHSAEAARWMNTLDRELANLRAACRWSLDTDCAETGLRLLGPLYEYAWSRMPAELSEWAEAACAAPAASGNPALPAALAIAALGAWRRGDLGHARQLAEQAAGADGPPAARVVALHAFADIPFLEGRLEEAIARYRHAAAVAAACGDSFRAALCAADIALARGYAGDTHAAAAADEACAAAEALGAPLAVAYAQYEAGEVRVEHSPDEAVPLLRRSVQIARAVGDRFTAAAAGLSATSIEVRRGDVAVALPELAELLDEWHRAGSWGSTWLTIRLCIDAFLRLGEPKVAALLLGAMRGSMTARPVFGTDAERLTEAESALQFKLGAASYQALVNSGATLGDDGAVALARRTLRDLIGSLESATGTAS